MLHLLRRIGPTDWIAGLMVIAAGCFAVSEASSYRLGTISQIGPGYFPVVLGVALVFLGIGIILVEGVRNPAAWPGRPAFRSIFAVVAAIGTFGLIIDHAGLAPAVFAASFLAGVAEPGFRPLYQILLASAITLVSILIFIVALDLPIGIFRW